MARDGSAMEASAGQPSRVTKVHASAVAWEQLEGELGVVLPGDYKQVVDGYGPVQLNGHLFLPYPAT